MRYIYILAFAVMLLLPSGKAAQAGNLLGTDKWSGTFVLDDQVVRSPGSPSLRVDAEAIAKSGSASLLQRALIKPNSAYFASGWAKVTDNNSRVEWQAIALDEAGKRLAGTPGVPIVQDQNWFPMAPHAIVAPSQAHWLEIRIDIYGARGGAAATVWLADLSLEEVSLRPVEPNPIPNPSFEEHTPDGLPSKWYVRVVPETDVQLCSDPSAVKDGNWSLCLTPRIDQGHWQHGPNLAVQQGQRYCLEVYFKGTATLVPVFAESGPPDVKMIGGYQWRGTLRGSDEWQRVLVGYIPQPGATNAAFHFVIGKGSAFLDDLRWYQVESAQ